MLCKHRRFAFWLRPRRHIWRFGYERLCKFVCPQLRLTRRDTDSTRVGETIPEARQRQHPSGMDGGRPDFGRHGRCAFQRPCG